MERISIQEISAILMAKNGLKKKEAERFVNVMFDVVKDGLTTDRLVKIKGLGTFKVIDIDSRESVDVTTGERMLIEGHEKITFTPDANMKELVNKPFSQFETVVLNEGVNFDNMEEETLSELATEDKKMKAVESLTAAEQEPEAAAVPEEPQTAVVPEPAYETVAESEPAQAETLIDFVDETDSNDVTTEEHTARKSQSGKVAWVVLIVLLCCLSLGAGYFMGAGRGNGEDNIVEAELLTEQTEESPKPQPATQPKKEEAAKPAPAVQPKKEEAAKSEPTAQPKKEEAKPQPADDYKKYEAMDARVRTGAYRIMGTDQEVKVKAGETLARISRRHLGPDMQCYVEVYNGLTSTSQLKEGQVIKIPKLVHKKKLKKANKDN